MPDLRLFNTRTRQLEPFTPLSAGQVGLYSCGPTVYSTLHLGNYRAYIFADVLKRTLQANALTVKHVMNITDVGHLTSDGDEGEDKLEKGAAETGLTVWDVAKKYTDEFLDASLKLNIVRPDVIAKATDHVADMITLVETLVRKGFTYETPQAVYFDVSKFPDYAKFSGQALDDKKTGAREDVVTDTEKKHPADFALWFKRVGKFANHAMYWPSPWGDGFPGWHIECSAMSMKYLGEQFDIHTGGIDHIPVHHTNEIAQSEAATGKSPFVNFWLHNEFLVVPEGKMSKSAGHTDSVATLLEKGIDPLAYRYFALQAHYRSPLTFSWTALEAAAKGLRNLQLRIAALKGEPQAGAPEFERQFMEAVNDDLNTAAALAVVHELLKSHYPDEAKKAALQKFEQVLGLNLDSVTIPQPSTELLDKVQPLINQREAARKAKDFTAADTLRAQINELLSTEQFLLDDSPDGAVFSPK